MTPFDSDESEGSTQEEPQHVRFRAQRDPRSPPSRPSWDATYGHADGWARFRVVLDMAKHTVAFLRTSDDVYGPMLKALAGQRPGIRVPSVPASERHSSLTFDIQVMGTRMSRLSAGVFSPSAVGDWSVIQIFLPQSAESFILAFNDKTATGELVVPSIRSLQVVIKALAQVFG